MDIENSDLGILKKICNSNDYIYCITNDDDKCYEKVLHFMCIWISTLLLDLFQSILDVTPSDVLHCTIYSLYYVVLPSSGETKYF
jgi:hypothetical protein